MKTNKYIMTNMYRLADYIDNLPHIDNFIKDFTKSGKFSAKDEFFNLSTWCDTISHPSWDYSMSGYQHNCGTAACIGGWAQILMNRENKLSKDDDDFICERHIAEWLGIPHSTAMSLFYPSFHKWDEFKCDDVKSYRDIKPHQAAEVIRLIAFGKSARKSYAVVLNNKPRPDGFSNKNMDSNAIQGELI